MIGEMPKFGTDKPKDSGNGEAMVVKFPEKHKKEEKRVKPKRMEEKPLSILERVDNLNDKRDQEPEDSLIYDLAKVEDNFRKALKDEGIGGEGANRLADRHSDEALRRIEAERTGSIDKLTGLKNRHALENDFESIINSVNRLENKNCALIIVDADHFKKVNDTYGHLAGDDVLRILSDIIKNTVRKSDMVYRYGGEEFIALLPGADSSGAFEVAEKIRKEVEETIMEVANEDMRKTVSIGVSGTDQIMNWKEKNIAALLKEMIDNSDKALYKSKHDGRNMVTVFGAEEKKDVDKNRETA